MVNTTTPSLLIRIRNHEDSEAWSQFCDIYGPLLFGYCRKRSMDSADAADVAQEVLLRVANGIRDFEYDRSKGRFRDWLSRIVHNEITRWFLRMSMGANLQAGTAGDIQDKNSTLWCDHFEECIYREALKRSRKHFEEATWRAFEMVWTENRSAVEVSNAMNRTLEFVYQAKSRVLKRIRLEVDRLAEDALFRLAEYE